MPGRENIVLPFFAVRDEQQPKDLIGIPEILLQQNRLRESLIIVVRSHSADNIRLTSHVNILFFFTV
jgi:hypothetical protein